MQVWGWGGRLSLSSAKAAPLPKWWSGGADAHPGVSLCQRETDREDKLPRTLCEHSGGWGVGSHRRQLLHPCLSTSPMQAAQCFCHILPLPWLSSWRPTSHLSKLPGGTFPFPALGADSPEWKRGWGEQEWIGLWAEKRAASPPECGSHSQRTAGRPIQNGCSNSWRALEEHSRHPGQAAELFPALHPQGRWPSGRSPSPSR